MSHPKTFYPDQSTYFLSGSTFLHYPYFKQDIQKQILLNQFKQINQQLNIPISAYSIAVNHYHLMLYLSQGIQLAKVKQYLHGGTAFIYKKKYPLKYQDFWQGSKVLLVASEDSYWAVLGYIIGNLLKHKEVSTFGELKANRFSSYWYIAEKYGDEFAKNLVYQVININEDQESIVDFNDLKGTKVPKPSPKGG